MSQDEPEMPEKDIGSAEEPDTRIEDLQTLVQAFDIVGEKYEHLKEAFEIYAQTVYLVEAQLEDLKEQLYEKHGMFKDLESEVEKKLSEAEPGIDIDKNLLAARMTQVKQQLQEIEMNFQTLKDVIVRANTEHCRVECIDDSDEEEDVTG